MISRTYSSAAAVVPMAALATAMLTATPAFTQTAPEDTLPAYQLEGVTVTTVRSQVDRSRIPQKIDVVTASELERTPAANVAEALRSTLPVDVIEYPGLLTGVSIRGFRPQFSGINPRTLVLVNGRPAGTNNLALLQLNGVERIEVLRGPGSALYGSSAMGGIINVVTLRSGGEVGGRARAAYGSFGDYEAELSAGGSLGDPFDFDIAVAAIGRRDGYQTGSNRTFAPDSLEKTLPDGSTTRLPWTTADSVLTYTEYGTLRGNARLGYRLAERWRLDLRGDGLVAQDVENPGDLNIVDGDSRSVKDVERRSFDLALTGSIGNSTPTIRAYSAREVTDYYDSPLAGRYVNYRTPVHTYGGQAQNVVRLGAHELTVGGDYTAAEAESESYNADGTRGAPWSPDSRIRSAAGFAHGRFQFLNDRLIATAGARLDHISFDVLETPNLAGYPPNTERHLVFAPSAGIRVAATDGVQLYGNIGRAFVTPDAFNVAGYSERIAGEGRDAVLVTRGNPDLRPETSRSWDLGLSLGSSRAGFEGELTYFSTDVRDRISIETRTDPGVQLTAAGDTILSTTTYVNVDQAEIRGLEGRIGYQVGGMPDWLGLRLFATGTRILEAKEYISATDVSQRVKNVADWTVAGGADYELGQRLTGRLSGRYVGERVDSDYVAWWAPGEILYPAHLVVDFASTLQVTDRYGLGLEIRNIADEDYFEIRGYNLPGRSVRLTVVAEF